MNVARRWRNADHAEKAAAMAAINIAPSVSTSALGRKRLMFLTLSAAKSSDDSRCSCGRCRVSAPPVTALDRIFLLVRGELRLAAHLHGPRPVFAQVP